MLATLALVTAARARRRLAPAAAALALFLALLAFGGSARAQIDGEPPPDDEVTAPAPAPYPRPAPPPGYPRFRMVPPPGQQPPPGHPAMAPAWAPPPEPEGPDLQMEENSDRAIGLRGGTGMPSPSAGRRWSPAPMVEVAGMLRVPLSERHRFEVGAELGGAFDTVADALVVSAPLGFVVGASHVELGFWLVPGYTRAWFGSEYFEPIDAYRGRFELGLAFPVAPHMTIGFSPLMMSLIAAPDVDPTVHLEGRFLWLGAAF